MVLCVEISHFKSIRKVRLDLARVTVLIGPPGSGKSNIMEGLALLGFPYRLLRDIGAKLYEKPENISPFKEIARFDDVKDLFYFGEIKNPVTLRVRCEKTGLEGSIKLMFSRGELTVTPSTQLLKTLVDVLTSRVDDFAYGSEDSWILDSWLYGYDRFGLAKSIPGHLRLPYRKHPLYLLAEDGSNIAYVLTQYRGVVQEINELFEDMHIDIEVKVLRDGRVVIFDHDYEIPYVTLSEGFGRLLYYLSALHGLENYVKAFNLEDKLVALFEEPGAHIFPYALQVLVNRIKELSLDAYVIISTHNPLLASLIADKVQDFALYYIYRDPKKHDTRATYCSIERLAEEFVTIEDLVLSVERAGEICQRESE